jgi:outer membrane immunogenic protein
MKIKSVAFVACALAFSGPASAGFLVIPPIGFGPASSASWLAGAVAGYNWQRGAFVFGFEGDLSGTGLRSETTGRYSDPTNPNFVFPSADVVARVDWYGTARARVGWATGSFLVYATGGLAYGNVSLSDNFSLGTPGQNNGIGPQFSQISSLKAGWVAGAGVEYMIKPNLSLNLEYQYVDLGFLTLAGMPAPSPLQRFASPTATAHAEFQAVTIGLNWHFGAPSGPSAAYASIYNKAAPPPPPPNPWAGFYAGGRAGAAWGNNLGVTPQQVVVLPPG